MARLFDELRAQGFITEDMPVIKCDNVSSYVNSIAMIHNPTETNITKEMLNDSCFGNYEKYQALIADGKVEPGKVFMPKDYPCVIPPFPYCFFEFKFLATNEQIGIKVVYNDELNSAVATFFMSDWKIPLRIMWEMDECGMITNDLLLYPKHTTIMDKTKFLYLQIYMSNFAIILYTTISFMHCKKQTKLIEHVPPEKVQRKRARRNKPPFTKYYTLDIEPLKEILRTEGRVHEVGLPKALHICRGHFKDYSQGKGLFGKYKGLYWWDSHIRGSEDAGAVVKDYAVKLPEVEGFN